MIRKLPIETRILAVPLLIGLALFGGWPGMFLTGGLVLYAVVDLGVALEKIYRVFVLILPYLAVTAVYHLFSHPGRTAASLVGLTVTEAGISEAVYWVVRLTVLVFLAALLTWSAPPFRLIRGLERILRPLKAVGVSAGEIAMTMGLSLRFFPLLVEEFRAVRQAQSMRGARFDSGRLMERLNVHYSLALPVIMGAFRRVDAFVDAIQIRGYDAGAVQPPQAEPARTRESRIHRFVLALLSLLVLGSFWLALTRGGGGELF